MCDPFFWRNLKNLKGITYSLKVRRNPLRKIVFFKGFGESLKEFRFLSRFHVFLTGFAVSLKEPAIPSGKWKNPERNGRCNLTFLLCRLILVRFRPTLPNCYLTLDRCCLTLLNNYQTILRCQPTLPNCRATWVHPYPTLTNYIVTKQKIRP